ncbi:MAG: GFA family protein [Novosphingobium sp.]|nr:GFA family protein [Novosphingobium sp.]
MSHSGQCFCGLVTYTIDAEPVGARTCWCRDCQYIASGSATNNILFPEEAVTFSGEIGRIEKIADSGNQVERGFCPQCGSQLFSRTIEPAGAPIRIRAGTLDDTELLAPQNVIWTDSAPSWAVLDPMLPHHPKAPQ